jgi:hypothetical protein
LSRAHILGGRPRRFHRGDESQGLSIDVGMSEHHPPICRCRPVFFRAPDVSCASGSGSRWCTLLTVFP